MGILLLFWCCESRDCDGTACDGDLLLLQHQLSVESVEISHPHGSKKERKKSHHIQSSGDSTHNASRFEDLVNGIEESKSSLNDAKDLVKDLEQVVAEVENYSAEALEEKALKKQSLAEMEKLLNKSGAIDHALMEAILKEASSPNSTAIDDIWVNASGILATNAANISELAKVARAAQVAFTQAIKHREAALQTQSMLTKEISDDLEGAVVKELEDIKQVKEIDLLDRGEVVPLTETTQISTTTAASALSTEPSEDWNLNNQQLIIIGLLILLGAAVAGIACMQER